MKPEGDLSLGKCLQNSLLLDPPPLNGEGKEGRGKERERQSGFPPPLVGGGRVEGDIHRLRVIRGAMKGKKKNED